MAQGSRGQPVAGGLGPAMNQMCPAAQYYGAGNIMSTIPPLMATAWFVDVTNGDDLNNGLSWDQAFATIQKAVDEARSYDRIYVAPGHYAESVVTRNSAGGRSYAIAAAVEEDAAKVQNFVSLIAASGPAGWSPTWLSAGAEEPCLTLNATGWTIAGFTFQGPTTAAMIRLLCIEPLAATKDIATKTLITNNFFSYASGVASALYGIEFFGGIDRVYIKNNEFGYIKDGSGGASAIICPASSLTHPNRLHIIDNVFLECDNYINFELRGCKACIIKGNAILGVGYAFAPTLCIDLGHDTVAGGSNIIIGNYLGGTYSHAGGYWESDGTLGGADTWGGNYYSGGITAAFPA